MPTPRTRLNQQESAWIREHRFTRLTDNKEVQIYPMGAERYLSSVLFDNKKKDDALQQHIEDKHLLVIPGHGNSAFLFAKAKAKSVTVYDNDPVTIAWVKAFKKYYHYREAALYPSVDELLNALTQWYPPLLTLPFQRHQNRLRWALNPNGLRRVYIHYLVGLVRQAVLSNTKEDFELNQNIQFHTGTINNLMTQQEPRRFDTAFIPYLLGVKNGIEQEKDIVDFIRQLTTQVPSGSLLITPSQNKKEFHLVGKRYFVTTEHPCIHTIPEIALYAIKEDLRWFHAQGLVVLATP